MLVVTLALIRRRDGEESVVDLLLVLRVRHGGGGHVLDSDFVTGPGSEHAGRVLDDREADTTDGRRVVDRLVPVAVDGELGDDGVATSRRVHPNGGAPEVELILRDVVLVEDLDEDGGLVGSTDAILDDQNGGSRDRLSDQHIHVRGIELDHHHVVRARREGELRAVGDREAGKIAHDGRRDGFHVHGRDVLDVDGDQQAISLDHPHEERAGHLDVGGVDLVGGGLDGGDDHAVVGGGGLAAQGAEQAQQEEDQNPQHVHSSNLPFPARGELNRTISGCAWKVSPYGVGVEKDLPSTKASFVLCYS